MSATAAERQTMHMVTYSWDTDCGEVCSWCSNPATIRVDANPAHMIDYACDDCAAGHMRSGANAIAPEPEAEA